MKMIYGYILSASLLLLATITQAQVLFFHNASDTLLQTMKIKVGDKPSFSINFRSTAIFNFSENLEGNLTILNTADSILLQTPVSLLQGEFYHCYINGLSTTLGYSENPNGADRSLKAEIIRINSLPPPGAGEARIIFVHGGTDLPDVDVTRFPGLSLVDDLSFGEYAVVNVPAESNIFNFRTADSSLLLISYRIPLDGRIGQTVVVMLSGFIAPAVNNNGPAFQGYIIVPGGDFTALVNVTPVNNREAVTDLQVFPNPAKDRVQIRFTAKEQLNLSAELYHISGQLMRPITIQAVPNGQMTLLLEVKDYPAGTYLLRISSGDNYSVVPVVISK
jgi:hypothetical protein